MSEALTEAEIRRIVRSEIEAAVQAAIHTLYVDDQPDLELLSALYAVQRDSGRISVLPLSRRLYVSKTTAWRRMPDLVRRGWIEPITSQKRNARRVLGWRLSQKARFALAANAMLSA